MNSKKMIMTALAAALLALLPAVQIHAQSGGFRFFGPLSRVITPNGDAINDSMIFCFDNFSDSGVSGRIYTLLGAEVAPTGPKTTRPLNSMCPGIALPQYVSWDGTANGSRVRNGIYVYRIEAEGKTYAGTFLVVR